MDEVPYREVEHQQSADEDAFSPAFGIGLGHAKTDLWWPPPTKDEIRRWRKKMREREKRRIPLGFR